MLSRDVSKHIAYLWAIDRPDEAPLLEATNYLSAPRPVPLGDGEPSQQWRLLGTAHATALRDADDRPTVKMWIAPAYGVVTSVDEVLRNGWYSKP